MGYRITVAGCQQVVFTASGSTASSAVIGAKECVVYATADCFINIAASPTAGATGAANMYIPANSFVELDTIGSEQMKIAARGVTEAGTLYITPCVTNK